ncbi:MAG: SDR family NAD(P)-dependent oxidoreductase [Methylobacter sp.]
MNLHNQIIMITGGTGSFGKAYAHYLLHQHPEIKQLIIFSRDEQKHYEMMHEFSDHPSDKLQFILGDVRNKARLIEASDGVNILIHSAAMKHVPAAEMNPMECVFTNILGTQNVVEAAIENRVAKVVALSTDKAVSPSNFYGASKLCLEKLVRHANASKQARSRDMQFSVVRYGNVFGTKGSVIPFFLKKRHDGYLPITHPEMTRFSITMQDAIDLVDFALNKGVGGDVILPCAPSYRVVDVANAIAPDIEHKNVGIRKGEKLHEVMFSAQDASNCVKTGKFYVIGPDDGAWDRARYCLETGATEVTDDFEYHSGRNEDWLTVEDLRSLIRNEIDTTFSPDK